MHLSQTWQRWMRCLRAVPLADKCLLVIMGILLFQSGHNLFSHELLQQENHMIDVVVRTTSAAIFGYFISANFLAGGRPACDVDPPAPPAAATISPAPDSGGTVRAEIGFHPPGEVKQPPGGVPLPLYTLPPERENRFQVWVVAAVGIAALLLLIVARDAVPTGQIAADTLSQLRDFVSGSVGFLLGHTTHRPPSGSA